MADDARGKAKHLKGKIEEGVGDLLGDRDMEREGRLEQKEGEAEQDVERARKQAQDAAARERAARAARRESGDR